MSGMMPDGAAAQLGGLGEDGGDGKKAPERSTHPPHPARQSALVQVAGSPAHTNTDLCKTQAIFFKTWIKHLCKTTAFPLSDASRPRRVFPSRVVKSFHFFFFALAVVALLPLLQRILYSMRSCCLRVFCYFEHNNSPEF